MLKIWGRANSTNVKKVLWCAAELELPFERIDAGGVHGVVDEPAYRAMNPNGLIPCLQDGDFVLWESNVIVRYLCAKYGRDSLHDADPAARAEADKWMDWTTSSLASPFRDVFWNTVRLPAGQRDDKAVEKGLAGCAALLAMADRTLAEQPFLSGSEWGMGDIPLGCFAYAWFEMNIERPDLPHLAAWYARLQSRPAYRQHVMIALT
ncbi:glutathione S-transferase family protein [Salinicola acroporae]|uniref:Glutathione S-transferase n=1 Tax=Salinicola acroporae TaxID=1541440 RepID=A0ABT6I9J7_9GAMM|nr:glutathione S-transferase [Salinicola acroporae]MDH4574296.1 glutathione S-transferase [Salinicola acroporae]